MSARSRMTYRCNTLRQVKSQARDSYNHPVKSLRPLLKSLPCSWEARTETLVQDGDKVVVVTVHRMMFPSDADVLEQDVVENVRDRRGRMIRPGKLHVKSLLPKVGHQAAILEEYR